MIQKMPEEFKGEITSKTDFTLTAPRKWTEQELNWVKQMLDEGYTAKQIADSIDRSHTSVAIKIKRLGKKQNTYNKKHVVEKYAINKEFLEHLSPKSILDVYAGEKSFYDGNNVVTNDIDPKAHTDYHKDAYKLLCSLYANDYKFDLIDLDPFGSAYDCFDLAIKMAQTGLCITLGELGHKRWKRLDYVSRYYDINSMEDFTIENLIKFIQKIGLRNKKELIVFKYKEWQNIGRVWFKIKPTKIIGTQIKEKTNVVYNKGEC